MSTLVARKHHRAVSREQVAQYSPGFTPIGPSYQTERNNIYLTRGSDSTSRVEGSASPLTRKTDQGCIHQVQKGKRLRRSNARSHIWKRSVRNVKNRWAQVRKQMNIRKMRATILVAARERSSKICLTDSLCVSCYIGRGNELLSQLPFRHTWTHSRKEEYELRIPLSSKGTILGVTTRTPTYKELQTCPHVTCSSAHEWNPHNVCVPKSSRTVEEEISRNIGAVMMEGGSPELTNTDSDSDSVYQIYDICTMASRIIGSFKVALIPPRNIWNQSDGTRCDTGQEISVEGTSYNRVNWRTGWVVADSSLISERDNHKNNTKTHSLRYNAPSEAIQGRQSVP